MTEIDLDQCDRDEMPKGFEHPLVSFEKFRLEDILEGRVICYVDHGSK